LGEKTKQNKKTIFVSAANKQMNGAIASKLKVTGRDPQGQARRDPRKVVLFKSIKLLTNQLAGIDLFAFWKGSSKTLCT